MSKKYNIDPNWIETIPAIKRKKLWRDAILTVIVLSLAWLVHIYILWGLFSVAILYWFGWIKSPSSFSNQSFWKNYYVQVNENGLFRYLPAMKNGDPIQDLIPWRSLKLKAIKKSYGKVTKIRLINQELPMSVSNIELENLVNMDSLLSAIEKKL